MLIRRLAQFVLLRHALNVNVSLSEIASINLSPDTEMGY